MDDRTAYLLSFLMIIIHRNGGEIVVEKLSEYSGKNFGLGMDLDVDNDRVRIYTEEVKSQ